MPYTIKFTDPNNPRGSSLAIADSTKDTTSTSLTFIGKNFPGYAESIGENFLHLLENFAGPNQPSTGKAVKGQLWFDTQATKPQLKVFDGQNFVPSGNVFKSFVAPIEKTLGDLWVDLTGKQLFFWSGASWSLIGPQFSEGLNSGPVISQVKDILNVDRTIVSLVVGGTTVVILSAEKFVPKLTIEGFTDIKPGINLNSTVLINNDYKFWGIAEKASSLLVGNTTVDSSKFLRSDTANFTNFRLSIRSDEGISIGPNNNTSLNTTANGAFVIYNSIDGSSINFKTLNSPNVNDVLTLQGPRVGVNNLAPIENLDIIGTVKVTPPVGSTVGLKLIDTTDVASNTTISNLTGSFTTTGGLSIAKKLFVGNEAIFNNKVTTNGHVVPKTNELYKLGDTNLKWQKLHVKEVEADSITVTNFTTVNLGVDSVAGKANKLSSPTIFKITGDVESTLTGSVTFDGSTGGTEKNFVVQLNPTFLIDKTELTPVAQQSTDLFLVSQANTFKKTTRAQLFARAGVVPVGTILSFAGATAPNGYLLCDGSEILRSDYPQLYSVIGDVYNSTTLLGLGTFKLPDLRGRFALGRDTMNNNILVPSSTGTPISLSGTITATDTTTIINLTGPVPSGLQIGMIVQKTSGQGAFGGITTITDINENTNQITVVSTNANTIGGINFVASVFSNYIPTVSEVNRITTANGDVLGGAGGNEFSGAVDSSTGPISAVNSGNKLNVLNPFLTINYIIFTGIFA